MTELETIEEKLVRQGFDEKRLNINEEYNTVQGYGFVFECFNDKLVCITHMRLEAFDKKRVVMCSIDIEETDTPGSIMEKAKQTLIGFISSLDFKEEYA